MTETREAPVQRTRIPRWVPPLAWAGVVLAASSIPDLQTRAMGLEIHISPQR